MPTKRKTHHMQGSGILGDILGGIHSAVKSSGVLSNLAGRIPVVGGIAGGLTKQLGYGKKKRRHHHGKGILSDLVGLVGLGRKHRGAGKRKSVIKA